MQQAMQVLFIVSIASDPGEKSLGYNVDEMPFSPVPSHWKCYFLPYALSQKVAFPSLAVSSAGVPITMSVHGSVR